MLWIEKHTAESKVLKLQRVINEVNQTSEERLILLFPPGNRKIYRALLKKIKGKYELKE